jgi:type IV secretory pathway TrbD component
VKLKKLAAASFAFTALLVAIPVAVGRASPASAALAFAIAAAPVAAIFRDAARRGLTDKKLEKAVNPSVAILSGFWAGILAEGLDMWLRDPLDIFLMLLNAAVAASVVGSTLMMYRIGLSEAEAPEAEERELTPEERYALRERMQRRINRWHVAAFGRIYLTPHARRREDSGDGN